MEQTGTTAWALAPLLLLALGFVTWVVVDIVRSDSVKHLPKWAWVILAVVSIPVGGIVYLLVGRDRDR
ncbi:MAG: PLD nuclease N-terminal domain-containing protein [Jiangellales bacterium]